MWIIPDQFSMLLVFLASSAKDLSPADVVESFRQTP